MSGLGIAIGIPAGVAEDMREGAATQSFGTLDDENLSDSIRRSLKALKMLPYRGQTPLLPTLYAELFARRDFAIFACRDLVNFVCRDSANAT